MTNYAVDLEKMIEVHARGEKIISPLYDRCPAYAGLLNDAVTRREVVVVYGEAKP
jgi:hypothetical protein